MRFPNWVAPEIENGKLTKYNWLVQNKENLTLGDRVDIGAFTYINAKHGVILEDFVQIGSHCSIYSLSTIDNKGGPVILKRNSRVGTHSAVMPNVTIGENTIVGAFSYVTKDIPKNIVAFGVPARIIRALTAEEIKKMEEENQ
jgi:acetyltransferase-like isoleucine patch superfamily enzyme